jgi:hypothetical protein
MRNYESENNFRERRGDILLKYTDKEVRQLSNAGELPSERISEQRASDSAVLFVDKDECNPKHCNRTAELDMPEDETDEEEDGDQDLAAAAAAVRLLCVLEEELPPPSSSKKSRRQSKKSSESLVALDFHHSVSFIPSAPLATSEKACPPPPLHRALLPSPTLTIRARVKFWDKSSRMGYATPMDKSQTKGGVDVRLPAECVEGLVRPLQRDEVVELVIDPRHDRPFVLAGGLRRVVA